MTIAGDRFWDYLINNLKLHLSEYPQDYYDTYFISMLERRKGTVMPPSPGVLTYLLNWKDIGEGIYYTSEYKVAAFVRDLVKQRPIEQLLHRSRDVSISSGKYQTVELDRRVSNYEKAYSNAVRKQLPVARATELWIGIWEIELKWIRQSTANWQKFITDGFSRYVREHKNSSIGHANFWINERMTSEQLREVLQQVIGNIEQLIEKPGLWNNVPWNIGIRARANPLTNINGKSEGIITRSRIINFHPSGSVMNAFLLHEYHGNMLSEIMEFSREVIQPVGNFYTAYEFGGKVYSKFADLMNERPANARYYAFDGAGWDSVCPIVLGPAFNGAMTFSKVPQLPSGRENTSVFGTVANMIYSRNVPGEHLILGDDHAYIGNRPDLLTSEAMSEDPDDTRMIYFLGQSYKYDLYKPVITGFKVTSDRGDLKIGVDISTDMLSEEFGASRIPETRAIWAGLFFGEVGDKTLLQAEAELGPAEHFAPREVQESLIDKALSEKFDAFDYAEKHGMKRVKFL
jgi:hypothetical protein